MAIYESGMVHGTFTDGLHGPVIDPEIGFGITNRPVPANGAPLTVPVIVAITVGGKKLCV
jgi:hypothetical protein